MSFLTLFLRNLRISGIVWVFLAGVWCADPTSAICGGQSRMKGPAGLYRPIGCDHGRYVDELLEIGKNHLSKGEIAQSLPFFMEASDIGDEEAYVHLVIALEQQQHPSENPFHRIKKLTENPGGSSGVPWIALAALYEKGKGIPRDEDAAFQAFSKGLASTPPLTLFFQALFYLQHQNYDSFLRMLEKWGQEVLVEEPLGMGTARWSFHKSAPLLAETKASFATFQRLLKDQKNLDFLSFLYKWKDTFDRDGLIYKFNSFIRRIITFVPESTAPWDNEKDPFPKAIGEPKPDGLSQKEVNIINNARQGDWEAQIDLIQYYLIQGIRLPQAFYWAQRLSSQERKKVNPFFNMAYYAFMLQEGLGCEKNGPAAFLLFQKVTEEETALSDTDTDNTITPFFLSAAYFSGQGVAKDKDRSFLIFKQKIEKDCYWVYFFQEIKAYKEGRYKEFLSFFLEYSPVVIDPKRKIPLPVREDEIRNLYEVFTSYLDQGKKEQTLFLLMMLEENSGSWSNLWERERIHHVLKLEQPR